MIKLVKLLNEETGVCEVYNGSNIEFALSKGFTEQETEEAYNGSTYLVGYAPEQPLEELKAKKLSEINTAYTQEADKVKIGTPEGEILSWDIQRLEAQAWQKDNSIATPFLTILAETREVEREWLINKVLEKVAGYELYIAGLTGKRQKLEDSIKNATTNEEVESIKW